MLACLDVDYRGATGPAVCACSLFAAWGDETPARDITAVVDVVEDYEPGSFYKRELPCLLAVLAQVPDALEAIVIDGHVWLGENQPGLGAHLYRELGEVTPIIGVAKNRYKDGAGSAPIHRGQSTTPLYISSIGVELPVAIAHIAEMAGEFRHPTLLKHVDRLCRDTPL